MMKILYKILLITSLTYQVNGEMSQYCVCGQIQESEFCDRSSICQWSEKKCKIKNGEKYLDLDTNEVQCSKYSQEDCRLKDKCGFYLGECIEFKECIQFKRDECSESSQRCVSDGMKCIDVGECEDYLTWMACQNRNKENQQCFWSLTDDPQCRVSRECNELPKYLTNDFECRQQISICTVSLDGGCEESEVECRKIKFEKQCFYNKAKTQQCYWDYELSICVDLICENMRLKSDEECKSQLQECTTNGQICVLRQECGDSKVIEGCVTDVHGNKCIFVNNECKKKECELAEDVQIYSNYVKCQQFDFGLDCVYKNGGGCKNRPIDCDQYEAQEDCLSIQTQNCYWMNNQCHRQGCQSQQLLLSHNECKQVGKCMGKIGGGCQDRPSTCNMITNREFCDVDYQNRSCYWQSNQCVEYICSSFVYPEFSNHLQCQTVNNKCTYDYYLGTCLDWTCERLHQNDCQSNSSCKMSKKCKLKQCSDAPTSLIDNTQCESWLKNCTVNVYQVSNIQQLHGCIQKLSNCNDYHQQQCYSTIDGYECKWTGSVCTFKICSDYNTSSITVCRNLKVKGMKCIIDSSLTTCIQWPTTCPQFYDYSVCSLGSSDGGQCYWDGTSCIAKDCNLSSGASNNYQCTQWNKKCNFDITNSTCKERNISDTCSLTTSFTVKSHQECNSWNNSCTVNLSGSIGCRRKQYNCSNYTSQQKCTESYYGTKCEWNTSTNICDDYIVSSCNGTLDLSVSQQLCEETSISCMNVNIACELLKLNCSDYIFQLQCKINAYQQPCVWTGTSCIDLQCSSNNTANNDSDCFNHFNSPKYCQQKIKVDGSREVGCEIMTTCASISNQAKCDQSVSQNEISCKFVSGVCQEFHQNNSQNCHLNLTALTNYECKQINDICELNYRSGIGCTASSCNLITNSGICVLQYPKGTSCSWDATLNKCQANTCSSYTSQTICTQSYQDYNIKCFWCDSKCVDSNYCEEVIKDYHKECNNKNQKHTVSKYQTCGLTRPNCSDYLSYSSCKFTTNGTKCLFVWTTVAGSSLPTTGLCQGLCTSFTNQTSCQANSNNCIWLGSCIAANRNCSDYSSTDCDTAITRIGTKCTIDISASCVERTCSNYKNGSNRIPTNQTDCDNWLDNCIFVTNICIDACQLAPISSSIIYTISICEQYKPNKICTTGDEPKCGNFLEFCSQATQEQCHYNSNNEKCFWNSNLSKCFDLKECSVLNSFNDTHEECIQLLNFCTVNDQQNGCKNLTDCQNYQYSFQCKINQNQDLCMWDVDKCITIECYHYTVESSCENSSFKSDPNKKCIWDHVNLKCILLNCDDLQIDQTHSCSDYTQYCINQNCKAVDCEDFQYDNETQCQQLYADKHCRTDGQSCLQRLNCNDCQKQICCNFDKNLNDCIWIYGKCYDRNCNSMPIIPLTYQECQLVSNSCTLKSDGGCQQKTNCNTYKNEYECLFDLNENNCLWDEFLQQCFSDICQPICGDGIVTYPFEECDDNNNRPYDGCYECKIQCSLGCLMCEGQICLKCNQNGWIYNSITQQCDSICGDGIITILEKCDDGNSIQFDGCYECDYQCSLECLNCYQGECLECQYGYYISNSYCYNKCGDGIIILEKEECDDGNLFDNDGCNSKCQIQQNWKCFIQDQQSFCIQQDQPLPILQMINQNPTQILFSFSQQVELSQSKYSSKDFINSISISISNLDKNKFNFTLTPLTEISRELLDVQYKIDLKFLNSIKNPILQLLFDKSILVNEIGNSPSSNNITLKLTDIEQLTNFQKTITDTAAYFNSIVIYVIISIAIVSTFLGNFEIFWNLLDNLQQLSYIKYININYPINFSVFLAIFDLISFQPVQNYINLDSILERFIQQDPPLIEYNVGKFQIFQTNCFFGTNFQSFVIILLISLVCYWTSQIFVYLLFKSKYSDLVVIVDTQARFIIAKFIAFLHSIQQMAMMYIRSYFYQGLVRIFLSSYYDLTFSSLLQIATYSQSTLILFISSILSIGTFGFNLLSILGFYSYSLLSNKLIKTVNSNMFFDGINLTFNKWNSQYQTILLLKKTTFISALVLLQVIPICQTLFISFQSISFTLYIIISKPMIKAYENFKIIVFEISIYLNSILFICHDLEYFNQYRMLIGWINIALFSGNLVCCLLIDIYQQFKILKENLCKSAPQTKDQINPMGFQKC